MDELERHLAAANMDLNCAQQSISSTTDYDEQIRILASFLTNQSPSLQTNTGNDLMNGSMEEHVINNSLSSSSVATNQSVQTAPIYQHNQISQYHQNNQQHHGTVVNNMAGHGQLHQINSVQQVGSPGPIHSQQMSPVNNPQLNQIRNNLRHGSSPVNPIQHHGSPVGQIQHHGSPVGQIQHHGSPVGQIQHHGSPVGQIQHHGSPLNHIQGQVRNLQSPSTPNAGSPVPPTQIQSPVPSQANLVHNLHGSGHMAKAGNGIPTCISNTQNVQLVGHHPNIVQHILRTSGQQVYSVPSSSNSVRINHIQTSPHTSTMVQSVGHPSNILHTNAHQQLNSGLSTLHTNNIPNSGLPINVLHTKLSNLGHVHASLVQQQQNSPQGKVLYSVTTSVPTSVVLQSHIMTSSSSGLVADSVQSSTTQNLSSSYQSINFQQSQITNKRSSSENLGTKTIPVLQQARVTSVSAIKNQTSGMASVGTPRIAWQSSLDGHQVYQNGFPSHSAQFVNDVINPSKFVMTTAHGIQNCTDSQLLQNITQSLVTAPDNQVSSFDNRPGINSQRIQLSAQTGTGS